MLFHYIYINEEKRIERIKMRNDNQSIDEIERRSIEDKVKFKNFNPNFIIDNNNSLNKSIEILKDYIIEQIINI